MGIMNNSKCEEMLYVLEHLRDECNCQAIKAEFEAEGSRTAELIMLCDIVRRAGIPLTIKIGGCEAARDMDQAKLFDADAIMAPMVETPYAMHKFKLTAKKVFKENLCRVKWVINAETKTCYENLDEILTEGKGFLDTVCVGRSDLSGSMGLKDQINGEKVFAATADIADKAREFGLGVTFGGKVLPPAIPFVVRMAPQVDAYETRKVTFNITDNEDMIRHSIETAVHFETLYMQVKHDYYVAMAGEDENRLEGLANSISRD